jgi:hypothetical protein
MIVQGAVIITAVIAMQVQIVVVGAAAQMPAAHIIFTDDFISVAPAEVEHF